MDRAFNPQTAPNVAAALAHGRNLLEQQPRLAAEQAREILASVPGSADGYRLLGEALRRTGEDEAANEAELAAISASVGPPTVGEPCNNVDKTTKDNGFVNRLNATNKPNEDLLFYATWSKGFRPGGVNRRGTLPPYKPDFLVNYEAGAKFSFGNGAHFNVAGYRQDWNDIQLSFLGLNGLTENRNAGNARIWGVEADLLLRPLPGLSWSTGAAFNDAKMRNDFCLIANDDFDCAVPAGENQLLAPKGTRLPLTARWKANSRARYEWDLSGMRAHVQGSITYEGNRRRDLRDFEQSIYGNMKAYTLVDAAAGVECGPWNVDLYVKNIFDVRGQITKGIQCVEAVCGDPDGLTPGGGKIYTAVTRPRTIGLRVGRRF